MALNVNIKRLIAEEKLEEAAEVLFEAFRGMFNTLANGISLSKEEFAAVAPEFVKKLQNPESEEKEPTDAPGDDFEIVAAKGYLKVTFEGPEDDAEFKAPAPVIKVYNIGASYVYIVPTIDGYEPSEEKITGTMTENVEKTITYTAKESGGSEGGNEGGEGGSEGGSEGGESGGESGGEGGESGGEQGQGEGGTGESGAGEGGAEGGGGNLDGPQLEETPEGTL